MPKGQPRLVVAGGGIAGLSTALALGRRGHHVHVLERRPQFEEVGAGLQLAPNALRVLDGLGVLEPVLKDAVRPAALTLRDIVTTERLRTVSLGDAFVKEFGYPYVVTHRNDLLSALLEGCRAQKTITLEGGKEVLTTVDMGDFVRVTCRDGSTYDAEGLIGADGLWSRIRDQTFPGVGVRTTGHVAYRGTLPVETISEFATTDEMLMWTGPGMHLIQYLVRGGELYNQVAVFWATPGAPDREDWGTPEQLEASFAGACAPVRAAIDRIDKSRRWPLFDRDPIVTWARNRIVITGDAAHPMLQFLAQGACQALEDAAVLADCVDRYSTDYPTAFIAFQNARVMRTTQIQIAARFLDEHCWHAAGRGASVRDRFLANLSPERYDELRWLYSPNSGWPAVA